MCQATVFKQVDDRRERFMEDVVRIEVLGKNLLITDITGKQLELAAVIREADLLGHEVTVEEATPA